MNDFTKDELNILLLDMEDYALLWLDLGVTESPTHAALREKLQSMIDNYCEHSGAESKGGIKWAVNKLVDGHSITRAVWRSENILVKKGYDASLIIWYEKASKGTGFNPTIDDLLATDWEIAE